jgi:capsular polysaccharide biosynthesis protein
MELRKLAQSLVINRKTIATYALLGGVIGIVLLLWPAKYMTTGSFYVKRAVDSSIEFFTYEGYYGQQTAAGFTNTVIALFESVDVQSHALEKSGLPVNENTLQKLHRSTKVTKYGPQLITLTVKGTDQMQTNRLWRYLAEETSQTVVNLNASGDPKLAISAVAEQPVSKKVYKSPSIYILAGILSGIILASLVISLKTYDQ